MPLSSLCSAWQWEQWPACYSGPEPQLGERTKWLLWIPKLKKVTFHRTRQYQIVVLSVHSKLIQNPLETGRRNKWLCFTGMLPGVNAGYFTLLEAFITRWRFPELKRVWVGSEALQWKHSWDLCYSAHQSKADWSEPKESDFFVSTAQLLCGPCGWLGLLLLKQFLTFLTKVSNLETKWCGVKGQRMVKEFSTELTAGEALLFFKSLVLSFPSPAVCCSLVALILNQARVYM